LSAKLKKSAKDKIEAALSDAMQALEIEDSSADDYRKAELALKRAVTRGMSTR
jgi:L1 cell adhesion molecule like protein